MEHGGASECINLKVANSNRYFDHTTGQSTTGASFSMTYAAPKSAEIKKESGVGSIMEQAISAARDLGESSLEGFDR